MKLVNIDKTENFDTGYKAPVREITIYSPVPDSFDWHRGTNFRELWKVKLRMPALYEKWKKQGKIPSYIINQLENESEYKS